MGVIGCARADSNTSQAKAAESGSPVRNFCVIFNVLVFLIPECGVKGRRSSSRPQGPCRTGPRQVAGWLRFGTERFLREKVAAELPALHSSSLCRRGNGRWTHLPRRGKLRRLQPAHGERLQVAGARPGRQQLREMHSTPSVGRQVWPPRARLWLGDSEQSGGHLGK